MDAFHYVRHTILPKSDSVELHQSKSRAGSKTCRLHARSPMKKAMLLTASQVTVLHMKHYSRSSSVIVTNFVDFAAFKTAADFTEIVDQLLTSKLKLRSAKTRDGNFDSSE